MSPMDVEVRSWLRNEADTLAFGRRLGSLLRAGDWVALTGDLGSGKTTLVAGALETMRPGAHVRSPTYVLVEVYPGSPAIVHADLYRVGSSEEALRLGLEDLAERDAVVLVEWADRAPDVLAPDRLEVELRFPQEGVLGREVRFRPRGERWESLVRGGALDRERWHDALYPGN